MSAVAERGTYMFGIGRRGRAVVLPAVAALVLVLAPGRAHAQESRTENGAAPADRGTLFGLTPATLAAAGETGSTDEAVLEGARPIDWSSPINLERVWAEDFHPETDRWTEHNNRIKISIYGAGLFPSGNLRWVIDAAIGARLAWEVPGFIGIRLDTVGDPLNRMKIRLPNNGNDSTRTMKGWVDCTSLSIAIFNPELSYPANLAMWAGLGIDMWFYHFAEVINLGNSATGIHVHYIDQNIGGNFFFDLQYKITDIFHVGIGFREHLVYAPQTEVGEFYHVFVHQASNNHHGRNNTRPVDISTVEEINVTLSVLF